MTTEEKLEKIKKLADAMYYAAANLGPNVGSGERLRKTMKEYHKFIIHEYNKEEPNFKVGDTIRNVDGNTRTVVEVREDCYKLDDCSILHFNAQDKWKLVEKNVSVDLEDAAEDYGIRQGAELKPFAIKFFKAGAKWQKQQMMKDAISAKVTEIYYPTDSCLEIEATLPEGRFKDGDKVLIINR